MAGQRNTICLLLCVVAVIIISEVDMTSSLPRHKDSEIVTEGITGDGSSFRTKRSYALHRARLANCRDKRNDCRQLIDKNYPSYYCYKYRGQCDVTCGVAACLGPGTCNDYISGFECYRAKLYAKCRERRYKEGCRKTCCSCKDFHPNCS